MSEHTPGPWEVERVPIQSRGGSDTAYKIGPFQACIYDDWRPRQAGISEDENGANARLIAAAPDLLEACRLARAFGSQGDTHDGLSVSEFLRKAIAKATEANP